MHSYFVVDTNESQQLVALRDADGAHHVARCTSVLPNVGARVEGPLPAVGFALLIERDGHALRLIFTSIYCSQQRSLGLLHPLHAVPGLYQVDRVKWAADSGRRPWLTL